MWDAFERLRVEARGARLRDVDVHGPEPLAGRVRRLAALQEGDDPALFCPEVVDGHAGSLASSLRSSDARIVTLRERVFVSTSRGEARMLDAEDGVLPHA